MRTTEAGELLLQYAYTATAEYKRVQDEMQDTANLKSGSVILGINTFRGSYMLPPVLNALIRILRRPFERKENAS